MTARTLIEELERLLESLGDRTDHTIALHRTVALEDPLTLEQLGKDLGLSRERIRQREARLKRRIESRKRTLPESLSIKVREFADQVGDGLIQEDVFELLPTSLSNSVSFRDPSSSLLFFLYVAGPYDLWGDLLIRRKLSTKLRSLSEQTWATLRRKRELTVEEADQFADWHGISSPDIVNQVLNDLQSRHSHVYALPGGVYVFEPKAADRAIRELKNQGRPLEIDELAQSADVSPATLLNYILHDERIVRTDRNKYGLSEWDHEEYDGIVNSIHQAIEAMGGYGRIEDVADWVTRRFDVSWNSVMTYAGSHYDFVASNGIVRVRKPDELPALTDHREPGVVGDCLEIAGYATLRVIIDPLLWRGSGLPIPRSWATRAGLHPGGRLSLQNGTGPINLSWVGIEPALGSLRSLAIENNWPQRGVVFLILAGDELKTTWRHYPPDPSDDPLVIARAMGCLFAFSEPSKGHPLGGDFWVILGERLGLQPEYRVPGMILARLKSRREKVMEPYVAALERSLLISESRGLTVQVNV